MYWVLVLVLVTVMHADVPNSWFFVFVSATYKLPFMEERFMAVLIAHGEDSRVPGGHESDFLESRWQRSSSNRTAGRELWVEEKLRVLAAADGS